MSEIFKAMIVEENSSGEFYRTIATKKIYELPQNGVLIRVHYSSLNYKDVLSATGNKGITRRYPHTPGIDSAGVVISSVTGSKFKPGDKVICTGYDLGMNTSGGFAEYINVPEEWVVPLPENISMREAMIIGTAGFTAAIGVSEIDSHFVSTGDISRTSNTTNNTNNTNNKILVTGATGGVGIIAVSLLSKLGYYVVASSGKITQHDMLQKAGAREIISREDVNDQTERALLKSRWAAAFDTVGGDTLSTVLRSVNYGGIVTNCGNVASPKLDITVFPFILRAVRLVGIAAAETPMLKRLEIWHKLSDKFKLENLEYLVKEVTLEELNQEILLMQRGEQKGRILVRLI